LSSVQIKFASSNPAVLLGRPKPQKKEDYGWRVVATSKTQDCSREINKQGTGKDKEYIFLCLEFDYDKDGLHASINQLWLHGWTLARGDKKTDAGYWRLERRCLNTTLIIMLTVAYGATGRKKNYKSGRGRQTIGGHGQ
jgi:hypothetical protein